MIQETFEAAMIRWVRLSAFLALTTRQAQMAAGIHPIKVIIRTMLRSPWNGLPAPKNAMGGNRMANRYSMGTLLQKSAASVAHLGGV